MLRGLNYDFQNPGLLELALTQSGVNSVHNNERLEFVGDRVLGLWVATMLYQMFPTESEGELARRHAMLVSTKTLAMVATTLDLKNVLHHGHMTGGRIQHVLANAMEAVLGAIYLDGGFDAAGRVIFTLWHNLATADVYAPKDPKTRLQEFVQKQANGELPVYEYKNDAGGASCPVFSATVTAMGKRAVGTGSSKKAASVAAAEALLKILAI